MIRSVEVDVDVSVGKHRVIRVDISNKGHICYITKVLRPKAFPRQAPVGCARKPVKGGGSVVQSGIDGFYGTTVACAEAELARLHDLVEEDGTMRAEYAGRDLGFRTRKVLLLLARARASVGLAGKSAYLFKWVYERLL